MSIIGSMEQQKLLMEVTVILKIMMFAFSGISITLAVYVLITKNYEFQALTQFFMAAMLLSFGMF